MYCWVILPFFWYLLFFVNDFNSLVIFSCFMYADSSYVCLNSRVSCNIYHLHTQLPYVYPNCCMFYFLSLSDCHLSLRLSGHEYFGHATSFLLELLDNSVTFCASVSRMQPVWKLLNWLFEQISICLTQRRIIVLLRMYLSLYCLCCLWVFLTLNS